MFKYIKWELINEAKSKAIILGIIAAIYLFVGVLPLESSDNILISFIYLAFIVILIGTYNHMENKKIFIPDVSGNI